VVLDFSTVNIIDITSLQGLIELRTSLDRYAAPALVEWHFAGVHNRWTRRALANAGFGLPAGDCLDELGNWCPAYTVATSLAGATEDEQRDLEILRREVHMQDAESRLAATQRNDSKATIEDKHSISSATSGPRSTMTPIYGIDRPLFHIDLHDAVDVAVRDAKRQDSKGQRQHSASESSEAIPYASRDESSGQSPV
jgi:sodium-independent sulfate anion transporter 11